MWLYLLGPSSETQGGHGAHHVSIFQGHGRTLASRASRHGVIYVRKAVDVHVFVFFLIFEFYFIYLFLYSRFLLVIYFIHISVLMSIPISQFIPPPSPPRHFPPLVSIRLIYGGRIRQIPA